MDDEEVRPDTHKIPSGSRKIYKAPGSEAQSPRRSPKHKIIQSKAGDPQASHSKFKSAEFVDTDTDEDEDYPTSAATSIKKAAQNDAGPSKESIDSQVVRPVKYPRSPTLSKRVLASTPSSPRSRTLLTVARGTGKKKVPPESIHRAKSHHFPVVYYVVNYSIQFSIQCCYTCHVSFVYSCR